KSGLAALGLSAALCIAPLCVVTMTVPAAADTPKRGGILTYMIPADAPPSFDGHRETTFATVHAAAPFYSVLIRVNPHNPSSTTDFVCDLCTEMPTPTDDGKTYTFKNTYGGSFNAPMLWNSNFFMTLESMKILRVLTDVWLPDFKFGPGRCAMTHDVAAS